MIGAEYLPRWKPLPPHQESQVWQAGSGLSSQGTVPYPTKKSFKVRISLAGFISKFWKSLRLQLSTQFLSFLILEIDQFSVPIKHIPVPIQCVFCNYRGRYRNTTLIRRNCGTSPPVGNGTNKLLHFFLFL